jgi:hypothetical protein
MKRKRNREYAGLNTIVVVEVSMERIRLGSFDEPASVLAACKSLAKRNARARGVVDANGRLHRVPTNWHTLSGAYYRAVRKAKK